MLDVFTNLKRDAKYYIRAKNTPICIDVLLGQFASESERNHNGPIYSKDKNPLKGKSKHYWCSYYVGKHPRRD